MNQIAILDLLAILLASVLLAVILGRAFARHEKPSYDHVFIQGWVLLFGVGNLLDDLSILPKGCGKYIAFAMLLAGVGYGLLFLSRRTAKRSS